MSLQPAGGRRPILKALLPGLVLAVGLALAACHQPSGQQAGTAAAPPQRPPPPPFTAHDASLALDALRHAPDHGFPVERFHVEEIEQDLGSAADQPEGQRRLRAAVIDYARLQHGLMIPLGALPREWSRGPQDHSAAYDATAELDAALRAGTVPAWLDGLPPQTREYRVLQAAYVAAKAESAETAPRPRLEPGPLDLDAQDARTAALRQRLAPEKASAAAIDAEAPVDQALIDRLRAYQTRHGLPPTGVVDQATADRLNAPAVNQASRLRVNLERLRWLPRPTPARRIDVNIAAAEMDYIRGDEPAIHMLAVSGKLGDETPIVSSAIDSIVLNPPWYVPNDIAAREIVPKGAAYMQSRHFVWRGGRVIQQPGPKTALGLVKFDFPNPYAVYLHDTPSKASFSQAQRAASHGCVRLQHAVELARIVATDEPGLSAERVDRILASDKTARLKLAQPVPVRLMYLTAEAKGDEIVYHPDVYSWDGRLLALIERYQTPRRRR